MTENNTVAKTKVFWNVIRILFYQLKYLELILNWNYFGENQKPYILAGIGKGYNY